MDAGSYLKEGHTCSRVYTTALTSLLECRSTEAMHQAGTTLFLVNTSHNRKKRQARQACLPREKTKKTCLALLSSQTREARGNPISATR